MQRAKTTRGIDSKTFSDDTASKRAGQKNGDGMTMPMPTAKSQLGEKRAASRIDVDFAEGQNDRPGTRDGVEMVDGNLGGVYAAPRASQQTGASARINQQFGPGQARSGTKNTPTSDEGGKRDAKRAGEETPL